jgi:hypothetical protein
MATKTTFLSRFCAHHRLAPSEFEGELFWQCLPPHGRLVVLSIWLSPRGLFEEDYQLIAALKEATSLAEINQALTRHQQSSRPRDFLRDVCRIRMSANRLQAVAQELFVPRPAPDQPPEVRLPWNAGLAVPPVRPGFSEAGASGNGPMVEQMGSSPGLRVPDRI